VPHEIVWPARVAPDAQPIPRSRGSKRNTSQLDGLEDGAQLVVAVGALSTTWEVDLAKLRQARLIATSPAKSAAAPAASAPPAAARAASGASAAGFAARERTLWPDCTANHSAG
jgi:hypothetical protein